MKDSFYFQHDSNARGDPKCVRLRRLHGLAGYGLYWCVIESLREADGFRLPLDQIDDLVFEFRTTREVFDSLLETTELLDHDEIYFWSNRLNREMEKMNRRREQASMAGKTSGKRRLFETSPDVEPPSNGTPTVVERPLNPEKNQSNGIELKEKKREDKIIKEKQYSSSDFEIGRQIFEMILTLNPTHKKPNLAAWASEVRKIREIDKRPAEEILELFRWANADNFWKTNILSPAKLREKWDILTVKRKERTGTKKSNIDHALEEFLKMGEKTVEGEKTS